MLNLMVNDNGNDNGNDNLCADKQIQYRNNGFNRQACCKLGST